jgi:O-antigen/teichoic acid export membrane protein
MFRTVYHPIIFKHFENKKYDSVKDLTVITTKLYGIGIIAICILLFAFSPILITYVFTNSDYLSGIYLIPLLFIPKIFEQLTTITAYGHSLYLKNYWVLVASVISVAGGVIAAYFLIPLMGLLGIGVVLIIIKSIHYLITFSVSQRYFKVKYNLWIIIRILLAAGIAIGVGVIFNLFVIEGDLMISLLVPFLISAGVYLVLIFLFRLIKKEDYIFVKNLVQTYLETRKSSV